MKKLNIGTGGHRSFLPDDLMHLSEAMQEGVTGLGRILGNWTGANYLSDTVITNTGTHNSVAAGCMVYKGEVCYFDNQLVLNQPYPAVLAWVPVLVYRACDPLLYADSSTQYPHEIKKVQLQYYSPGYAPADYVNVSAVKSVGQAISDRINGNWVNLVAANGWVATGAAYRVTGGGKLEFKGYLDGGSSTSDTFFTLPTEARPAYSMGQIIAVGAGFAPWGLRISNAGVMSLDRTSLPAGGVYLDGVAFYL